MTLNEKYSDLQVQKMKLDKFFSMFLDSTDTPVWKLYKNKLKEYEKVSHELRTTQYWISKE